MPMYEYLCRECGRKFEKLTSLARMHMNQECPNCGKETGERIMSAPSLGVSGGGVGGGGACGPTSFG